MNQPIIENLAISEGYSMANILSVAPDMLDILKRKCPTSYDDFVCQIDIDINNIISNTETGKQHHMDKGEDALTEHIIAQLKQIYSSVHHDAQHGGHCDIYIETTGSTGQIYKWIMEAKIWDGFEYVYSGLENQLLNSYASAGVNNDKGGLIFYSNKPSGALKFMNDWINGLKEKGIEIDDLRSDGLRFKTRHKLNSGTGSEFQVSHYCIDVYHKPTDKKIKNKKKPQDN